jgi:hypothetical protein
MRITALVLIAASLLGDAYLLHLSSGPAGACGLACEAASHSCFSQIGALKTGVIRTRTTDMPGSVALPPVSPIAVKGQTLNKGHAFAKTCTFSAPRAEWPPAWKSSSPAMPGPPPCISLCA